MKTFKDLIFKEHGGMFGGIQSNIKFDNGYEIFVAKTKFTYGGSLGLYEIEVIKEDTILSNPPIMGNIIGHLSESEVTDIMLDLQKL
jgi:hypothetical protein